MIFGTLPLIIIIMMMTMIMYIYDALINALSVHTIHINLNTIFYTYAEDNPTKTIYTRHYMETHTHTHTHTHLSLIHI